MATSDYYVQDNADIEEQKLEAAKGLYRSGDYKGSLRIYLDLLTTNTSYKLYYEIGRCYYKLEDMLNAELYFNRSISLEEFKNPSYLFLGNIFYKRNDISKAIEYWITSYSYKPDDESICLNLATSYFSKEMKFYSLYYYEKYLQYAKDKTSSYYLEIKKSIEEFIKLGNDFYQKAQKAISMGDNITAIQALEYAVKNFPTNFDINHLLGKIYYQEKDYKNAKKYLEQAFCLDSKSIDILQKLSEVMINLGDFTGAYCCLKRIMPLVTNNQREYLNIIRATKEIETRFEDFNYEKHLNLAEEYYQNNNYNLALYEYENCIILNPQLNDEYGNIIQMIKSYLHPEEKIIKQCLEKGSYYYTNGEYRQANKYFTKIISLAKENSSEYKLAKARIENV